MIPTFDTPSQGAIHMRELGFHVFPLQPNTKIPLNGYNWKERAPLCDNEEISRSFQENFAVCLSESRFVLDVDTKNGARGAETLAALELEHGALPATFTVETPTGGRHYYFIGRGVNSAKKLGAGLDTKAANGYVVAPGSKINRGHYSIIVEADIAEAPQWLIDLMHAASQKEVVQRKQIENIDDPDEIEKAIEYLKNAEPAHQGHGGDAQTYKVGCRLHDLGLSLDTAVDLMLEHFDARCEPSWGEEGIRAKIENAWRYSQNSHGARTAEATQAEAVEVFKAAPLPPMPVESATGEPRWLDKIRRVTLDKEFPEDDYILSLEGEGVIERGDVAVLQAKTKAGKSSAITAMMASMFVVNDEACDFLGWSGANVNSEYVLHFDTEQKEKDSQGLLKRAVAMAKLDAKPAWFISMNLKALTRRERREAVDYFLALYSKSGRVLALFIDGIGDLCDDTNDKALSEKLGENVVRWTQHYGCAVVTVLHENPSMDSQKMRGHLGTYLEMKAEAIFRLEKDGDGIFTLWAEKMRRGHIAKGKGPSWKWDAGAGRPVSTMSVKEVKSFEAARARDTEKEKCLKFLRTELPNVGDKRKLSEVNAAARKQGHAFADKNDKADRFERKIDPYLAEAEPEFKIYKGGDGKNSPLIIERLATLASLI